jgi:hypothetical protein
MEGNESNSGEMKAEMEGSVKDERYGRFFPIKKIDWEATVLPNVLGSTVATQPKMCKNREAIVGQFFMFFIKFSLNIGKGTIIGNLLLVLLERECEKKCVCMRESFFFCSSYFPEYFPYP